MSLYDIFITGLYEVYIMIVLYNRSYYKDRFKWWGCHYYERSLLWLVLMMTGLYSDDRSLLWQVFIMTGLYYDEIFMTGLYSWWQVFIKMTGLILKAGLYFSQTIDQTV